MLVGKSEKPAASIVVPAYKSAGTIVRCLEALVFQETDLAYEIIVVESSGDGAADIIRERFPAVILVATKERLFSGAARNFGAEKASGEMLGFVDSDCIVEQAWLEKMWKAHREHECAAVAGSILNGNPETATSISSYLNEFSHFYSIGRPRYVHYLPSGNISYKAQVFRKHGGFDPNEPLYVDLMFNTALSQSGEKLLFAPYIRAAHLHRTSLMEYLSHELKRGRAAAVARRRGLLIGSSWAKCPPLALLITPGLFLRKAIVFPYRFARAYPLEVGRMIRALPCFHLALLVWHYGFLKEILMDAGAMEAGEGVSKCAGN